MKEKGSIWIVFSHGRNLRKMSGEGGKVGGKDGRIFHREKLYKIHLSEALGTKHTL